MRSAHRNLMYIKRQHHETLDEYLNRFRQLMSRCYTNIPEHELVKIAATGLDSSIRKKLVNEKLRDMAQLAEKVRRIEQIRAEKERLRKFDKFVRKEKVAYLDNMDVNDDNFESLNEEMEVNLAELQPGPTYQCQLLKPGENNIEVRSNRKYSFDVTKADKIFDILLKDKQITLPKNHKIPPFEQRKGKIFDYAGKSSQPEGMILLDVQIGSVNRTTMFIVTPSKANFNVLLGREWIHGMGAVPSTVHQKVFFWNDDEHLEVLDVDQKEYETGMYFADQQIIAFVKTKPFDAIDPYVLEAEGGVKKTFCWDVRRGFVIHRAETDPAQVRE
uniref:Retrotransposon gag domain-containing protein n=1 Tax=Cajanus cajan TaxID=3821 RepID=A0A151UHK3_CAJCA